MVCVKSAGFVFLLLFFAVASTNDIPAPETNNISEGTHNKDSNNDFQTPTNEEPMVEATAKKLITRKKKISAANPDKHKFTNAIKPKISKITLRNRSKPDNIPLHHHVDIKDNPKLKEIEEKIKAFRSRINADSHLQSKLHLPDHENLVEKIKERNEELKREIEAKHQEFEQKLRMAHLKLPVVKETKEGKNKDIVSSINSVTQNEKRPRKKIAGPKIEPRRKIEKEEKHHHKSGSTRTTTEKPVIILDHRNGESKIQSTTQGSVIEKVESTTRRFEETLEKLKEKREKVASRLKEKLTETSNRNKDGTLKIVIE